MVAAVQQAEDEGLPPPYQYEEDGYPGPPAGYGYRGDRGGRGPGRYSVTTAGSLGTSLGTAPNPAALVNR